MCGIGGIISKVPICLDLINNMMEIQSHRGPDGEGYLYGTEFDVILSSKPIIGITGKWAVGHKRLSVVDLSQDGAQPMASLNEKFWVVYNGEIYNFRELKVNLESLGWVFKTQSDTEIILASFQEWGLKCFEKFNGMWALAIVELDKKKIVFSRDRFGEKPLHYYKDNSNFIFASEIKGVISALGDKKLFLNETLASDYLLYSTVNHTNQTFFKDIYSFPPASYAIMEMETLEWDIQKYWDINDYQSVADISFQEASKNFEELFFSSVHQRMNCDVPVGFCLSGGLDSSSIVCAASKLFPQKTLDTFTSVSEYKQFSEKQWAEIVNKFVHADSQFVNIQENDCLRDIDDLIYTQEEPFTTTSIYAQWLLMSHVNKKSLRVVLDGQGADEILCGYRKYYLFHMMNLFKSGAYLDLIKSLVKTYLNGDSNLFNLKDGKKYLPSFLRRSTIGPSEIVDKRFLCSHLNFSSLGTIKSKQINDLLYYSLPSLLRYEDRNSMRWSVESRVPFLDNRIVEFLFSLPDQYKLDQGKTKLVMRSAFKDFVPESILNRKDKMGFATPQKIWMKHKLGEEIIKHFKKKTPLSEYINNKMLEKLIANKRDSSFAFRLFILDKWMEKFKIHI